MEQTGILAYDSLRYARAANLNHTEDKASNFRINYTAREPKWGFQTVQAYQEMIPLNEATRQAGRAA